MCCSTENKKDKQRRREGARLRKAKQRAKEKELLSAANSAEAVYKTKASLAKACTKVHKALPKSPASVLL